MWEKATRPERDKASGVVGVLVTLWIQCACHKQDQPGEIAVVAKPKKLCVHGVSLVPTSPGMRKVVADLL